LVKQWKNKNEAEGKTDLSGGGGGNQGTRMSSWWWWLRTKWIDHKRGNGMERMREEW